MPESKFNWKSISDYEPPPHKRYIVLRDGEVR